MERTLQLLKDIVDQTPLPIGVYIGTELRIELANQSMIETWGKGDQVLGKTYFEILPEIGRQNIFDQALEVLRTGIPFHAKDRRVDLVKEGELKSYYFNYSFIPLLDSKGEIYGVMNTGMDITDLHLAREKVQSSEEQLRMAIDASGMGTYEIDLLTNQIKTSGNFKSIWPVEGEISNEKITSRLHPDDLAVRERAHQQAHQSGIISYQARILNEDNSMRWVRINGKIIKDSQGNSVKIAGVIEDIEKQKVFEEKMKKQVSQSMEELRRSNEDLQHFANLVSHDLREPVRKIKTFMGLLKREIKFDTSAVFKRYLSRIDHSAERMENIIEGILNYSAADKKKHIVEWIDLGEILEDIKIDFELVINDKNAQIVHFGLPKIEGAPILIQQLFYNLVQNALKFSKPGEFPYIEINSKIIQNNDRAEAQISIQDNGIGIENQYTERIFNAFERLHSKDQYEGSGLGLSLCRKIVNRHGGQITAVGEAGKGAEFILTLPLEQNKSTI